MRHLIFVALILAIGGSAVPARQTPATGITIIAKHPDGSRVMIPVSRNEMYVDGGPTAGFAQPVEGRTTPFLSFSIRAWKEGDKARVVVYARLEDARAPEGVTETPIATFVMTPRDTKEVREAEKWGGPRLSFSTQ